MIKLSRKVIFFGCWKSLSAASKCRKTHPYDYRISKFSGGACPRTPLEGKALRALPILCPGVKLTCPPVQNLNEPPDVGCIIFKLGKFPTLIQAVIIEIPQLSFIKTWKQPWKDLLPAMAMVLGLGNCWVATSGTHGNHRHSNLHWAMQLLIRHCLMTN